MAKEYNDIKPGKKRLKTFIAKVFLYFVGMGFQTCSILDKDLKKEIETWPETFTFVFGCIDGPQMVLQKRNGRVEYFGARDVFHADLIMKVKNVEYLFKAMVGMMSTPTLVATNRIIIEGDLNLLMSVTRGLGIVQSTILPPPLPGLFYLRKAYPFTLRRFLTFLVFNTVGVTGQIRAMSAPKPYSNK